ncbi:UNVERIFIED_CONTAM: hypothetical protein RMT77_016080 [Armadillidium vulgare]
MGNVESRPINRPIIEVSHKTARPLPPLPDDEIDEYDLDSPPPYPPPPPPHEENGGKSKRISWKFKEPSFFGGLKRGSWVLQPHSESDPTYKYHDTKKGTPTFTGKNISNTIATEDNNVVTVSVIGTPDKDDVIKSHNDSTTMDGSQNSWAVRNMQLVLNSEINSSSSSKRNISDPDKVEPSLESKNYPYPDVQTYSENEMSSLPDVVTVKTRKLDTSNEGNVSVTKETVHLKRVEDIRLDYPEGKTREVSNYNTLEYKEHTSVQPLSLQVEHDVSSGRASADVKNDSKSKKGKLPSCFGKRKADDISDEEFDDTAFSIENQRSGASSPESKTLSLSPSSEINLNVTPASSTPKKTKKTKIGSCFSKSPSKDEIDGPLSTSTPDIDSRLNLRGSGSIGGSSERVEYITPKLEVESDIDTSLRKDAKSPKKPKSNFGSCFGKDKSGKLDKSLDNEGEYQGGLQLKAEGEYQGGLELKADKSSSIPDSDINADLKTKNLKHSKKSPLTAWFGKDSKHKYEVTNASEEFEIKTDHDDVVGRVDVRTPEIELKKEGMSKNVNIDNEIEIALPTADFEIKSPEANISLEGSSLKTDLHTNINPELTAKFPEKYSQSTDFNFSPSKNIHVDLQTPEIDIKQPTLEIETPKLMLKDSDIPDNNLALNLDANLKNGEIERKSKEMNISYSPTLEFKDNNFNSNQKLEIIPPCVDLRINPDVTGEEIEFQPVDLDKSLEINLKPQPLDIKGSIDVPSANIELQKNDELKLEIPGFIAQEPKQPYDLPELNLEIDTHGKGDINSGKIEIDLATPKIEPQLSIQPKKIDKPKKPKAKFGSCFGKPKADVDMDVQSPELKAEGQVKTAPINVSSPSIEVEGFVANADDAEVKGDVELRGPKIEGKIPKESGKGKFKLGSCLGKDKSKPAKVEKREIDVDIPEGDVKGSVNVETPKIEGDVNIGKENVDVKKPKVDGKGKVGLGSCFGKSKTPKVETEVNVPETDISGPSVSGGELEADVKVKSPKLDVKGDIDSSLIKSDIDVETPEIKVDAKKKKGSLGSCFGKRKSPDADIKKPSLEVEGEIKGVPSIEGEMKVEGELPSGEIPSKKKKGNLGSCFGKKDKPKLKADIDIEPPKAKLSEDIPSVNIEANVPDVTLDPNIKAGTLDLNINNDKPEMSFDLPSVNVEGNIPEASLDVDVPSVSLKSPDIDLDFPKCEGKIEGKVPDISLSHNVDFDVESPDLDFNGDVDFSVEGPKLPSAELDLGVSGSDIKLKKIEGTVEGELPKFDPKFDIDIDTSLPKTNVEIAAPEITMKKEGSVKVPTPDIDIDISGNVPDVELEGDVKVETPTVDVKGPKIKGKKVKSKMPSCFGKDDKTKKGDAYMPSCEGEISVKSPDVTGKVDVESPSLEGDASIRGPDLKVETKKPKGKLGSCFGKPKSPKAPKVEGKLSSSVEGDLPTLKGEIDAPKAEVKVDVEKPTKKSSSGLGSCFGKKAKVDANIETPSVDVAAPSGELSVDVDSPQLKSDIKVEEPNLKAKAEVKKPKSKFGSCFGKPKADVDMTVDSPELETDVKVKTPSLDISTPSVGVEGSVDVPSVGIDDAKLEGDVELRGPKVEGKTPKGSGKGKFKLGSCLGKDKSKSVKVDKPEAEVVIPEGGIKGSVEVEAPKIEGDVKGPKVDGKRKLGLGSCFGKSKSPKLQAEVDVPESNISGPSTSSGKLDADIKLKSPELDIKADVDSPVIKSEIDLETPEIKVDGKKKKKGSLGSCFGKRKSTDADIKKPSLEVEGEIKGVPSIEGEMKVEGELQSGEIPSKKKKLNLGSCFGKKDKPKLKADIDIQPPKADISTEIPSVNIEANVPDVTLDPNIKAGTLDLNINNDKPEMSFDLPSVNVEGNIPEASLDVDVPSVSLKSPDIDLDFPKCEGKIGGKVPDISLSHNVDLDVESPDLDYKGGVDYSVKGPELPSAELDLGVSGSDIKLPKIEGTVEGELPKFDPKFDIDIDTSLPKTDVQIAAPKISMEKEGRIKVPTPDIDIDISGNVPDVELEGDVKVEAPTVDVKGPKIKGKKVKSKMPSCFGKGDKTKKGDAYMPSCEGEISVKSPDVTGKVDVESPSLEGDASIRGPDLKVETKKPKGKLGSCFGKPKSPKAPKVEGKLSSSVEGELPTLKGEIDAPKAEVKVDVQKPTKKSSSGLGSCFGKKAKVDANIETPSVDVAAPSGELSVDVDSPQLKSDIKVEEPNLKVKGEVKKPKSKFGSCFGKPKADVDMTVDSPELETDVKVKTPSLDISTPSVGVEGSIDVPSVGIDDTKLEGDVELRGPKVEGKTPKGSGKGKFKLGSCFGKDKSKSVKVDKPEAEVVIPEGGIKGSVEVEGPKIEGDVKGPRVEGKRKLGLGSCFGKSKSPKVQAEVDVPEPNISGPSTSGGKLDADIKLKSPELDIKADVDSPVIKSEIDVETPEIKVDGKKKKKGSLGSCFGKRKSTDADIKKPSLEVEGDIKGVPSIEGEMKVEGELPSGEIPSKKKKLNLGSCFGKKDKPKIKADIDIQPPKAEISPEIPSVNMEANVPDVTLDPSIKAGTLDLNINNDKPEISFDLPSVNVEGNIPEASLDVDVPSVFVKSPDIDLDFPKCEGKIEGKVPDISLSHNVDFDVESPDLDFNGDVDFSVEGPKLPSAELDLGVSGSDIKLKKIEGTVEGELPKFDPKFDIDIDTSLPKTDVEIAAPEITMKKEGSVKVPTPDIDIDISGNVPDIELEGDVKVEAPTVDVKGPKIKGKKGKSKMPSCFGKGDKTKKGDAYMPSCEGEISVKSPDVTGKVDVESPSLEGDASIRGPDLKVETKKPKRKLGSCFGKPKSPKAPKVEGKLSSSVEGDLPTLKGEIDAPKAEVKVDVEKPTKKSSSGLGSCFGKKAKVDANIKTPSVDVAAPSGELSVDVDSPKMKSDIKVEEPNLKAKAEVKKPKSKFGSCFGKPKADVDTRVDSPELETDLKVKTPSLDIRTPSVGVEGSVDVPSVGIDDTKLEGDVELRGPKVEGKTPKGSGKGKFKLGSCLGKDKSKSVKVDKLEAEVVIPEGGIKGSVEVEAPKIEGDVKGPKVEGKRKLGLGSCFGKSKSPKLQAEVDVPEPNISGPSTSGGKLDADIKLKSPELDIKADVDSPVIKSEIDVETPEIKVDGKKKKGSLGSCFGKRKSPDADVKKPSLEVEGEIKGVPSIEGEMKVEGELPSGEIPSKKKKLNLGSCFGKKDKPKLKADIDIQPPKVEISPEIPSVNIEANVPDVTLDPSIKAGTLDLNINNDKPEMSFDLPSVNVEGNIPEASLDVDVPSVSVKYPDIDLDFPKYEGKIEGKVPDISVSHNVDLDIKSPELDFKGDVDVSVEGPKLPSAELDLGVSGSDIKLPKIEGTVEGELPKFDPKLDIDIDTSFPKVDVEVATPKVSLEKEGSIKVPTPDIEMDISGNVPDVELEGDVKVEVPAVDVKGPKIKGKKGKSKMPSCFGKGDKAKKRDAYMPSCEGEISVKSPDVTGKVDVESPSLEGDASIRGPDLKVETKKPKGKLGSCFGKPKSPKAPKVEGKLSSSVEGDLPTLKGEIDAPKAEVKVDVEKPTKKPSSGLGSCFGKKAKVDAKIETPSVDVAAPSGELSVDVDSLQLKSDVKVEEQNLKAKAEVKKPKSKFGSCFGKPKADVDMTVDSPELETDVKVKTPSLNIGIPSVGVEGSVDVPSVGIDDAKLGDVELRGPKVEGKTPKGSGKGKFKLGSCLGKDKSKSVKVDKPEAEIVIPEGDIKGSVEVESPKIEGDIKVKKENIDVKGPSGKGKVGLGSCFGKSKTPKLKGEVNVPETNLSSPSISSGEIGADVKIKSPTLEIKDNVDPPVIKGDVNVETPEIKVDGKKKKGSLGSCFGKRKAIDIEQKKPSLEVEGEVKGVPSIEGEMKVEGELPSGEIPSKKKKLNLGSCFGKKDKPKLKADIDIEPPKAELSAEIPSINIESNVPDVTLDTKVKVGSTDLDININKPEISAGLPSVIIEENIPEISLDADVPSVSLKSPDVNLDFPKYEVGVEGKVPDISVSPNVEMDVKSPDFKEDIDFSFEGPKLPSAELDLVVSGSNKKVPKIEGTVEGELPKFDPKFDIDIDTSFPKVDAKVAAPKISLEKEDSLKVPTPDIEVDISSNVPDVELKGDVKVETPTVDVKESKIKGKKIKSKMPSCFGKNDKDNESAYIPTSEGDVKVKSLHPVDFDASLSSVECNGSPVESGTRNKKKKINFGSCLGKKSGADLKANSKLSSPEVISPVSGELDFSVNGLDSFDGNQLSISSPEKSIHSKGFPQVTVTSNVENDMQVERNGPGGDFSVEFPLASVDNEISGSVRYPDVIAVGADLSASTEKTKPCEGTSFENDFSEDILAQCSNISIDKDYGADISYRYSGDDLPPLYENVSKSSTGKDILPNKKVEFEITSNFPEKTSDIKIVTEPSHTAATASPDLKVHFLDNDDSLEHSHPAYSNIDSRVGVNIPTYENVTFTSPYSLPQKEPSEDVEISEVPKPPKRWFGIDGTTVEGTVDIPNVDMKTDFVLKDNETDIPQSILSEAKSDFQSIQFVKQMVEDDERGEGVNEGRLGKISFTSSRPEVAGQFHTKLNTSDLLAQKLEEFDNNTYDSQPVVKRTIKVKTFKIKEGSDEPEEVIEEFEAEGEELQCDAAKLLSEKLAELRSGFSDSQPEVKRTVRIKTFKTKEGSNEPEELIEEFVNESKIPLDSSAMFKTSFDEKDKRGAKYFEIKDDELKEHAGSFDTSDLLIKKLSEFDMDSSRPVVKRTVRVKTYSTKDGDDDSEEIVEEFEGNEDTSLGKSEATKYLLKKIADFDGKGISGEPFVKRTVKVKTYKTKEGSDDTETIEEFEHSSTDISLSDILHDRYPELRDTKFESHDILKSLENPNSQEALSAQSNVQIGKSGELEGSIQVTHGDAK